MTRWVLIIFVVRTVDGTSIKIYQTYKNIINVILTRHAPVMWQLIKIRHWAKWSFILSKFYLIVYWSILTFFIAYDKISSSIFSVYVWDTRNAHPSTFYNGKILLSSYVIFSTLLSKDSICGFNQWTFF